MAKDPFEGMLISHPYRDVYVVRAPLRGVDPYQEAARIVDAPWREHYGTETMVIDTIDAWATEFKDMSAEDDVFAGKKGNIRFGKGKYEVAMSDRGDYQAGQKLVQEITNLAFDQDMHLIVCAHVGIQAKTKGESGIVRILRAGAATVGGAQVDTYGGQYDQYWRLKYKTKQEQTRLVCQFIGDPIYNAKLREDGELPPPEVPVPNTLKEQREFWIKWLKRSGIDLDNPELTGWTRACLYGEIGTGKTRLGLSFPKPPFIYVAVDANAEYLRSMYRELKVPVEEVPDAG